MTLRHLKIFVSVCDSGSVTRTADSLNIAQPSVSQSIKELENYYSIVLFNRINQRLVLTDSGRELYIKAKEILANFKDFEDMAYFEASIQSVKIGASLTIGNALLLNVMDYIKNTYPNMKVYSFINNASEILDEIKLGNLDFGIIEGDSREPNLESKRLFTDKLKIVCGSGFKCKEKIELSNLSDLPLLLREKGSSSRDYLEDILAHKGVSIEPSMESISNNVIINATKRNYGLAILPEALVDKYIEEGALREISINGIKLIRTINLIWHKNIRLSKEKRDIMDKCLTL